jgi:hypothetical protein
MSHWPIVPEYRRLDYRLWRYRRKGFVSLAFTVATVWYSMIPPVLIQYSFLLTPGG